MFESCVDAPGTYMRTYQKHTARSMMSALPRLSLPGSRQGKSFPCHALEIRRQAIDFTGRSAGIKKLFPLFPCRQGKFAMPEPPALKMGDG
jgi:hypothetical protein